MRQNRRRTGSRRSADDKIKYMRMAAIPLVIVLVLVAVILVMDRKPSDKEHPPQRTCHFPRMRISI